MANTQLSLISFGVCDYIYAPEGGDPVGGGSKDPIQQQQFYY